MLERFGYIFKFYDRDPDAWIVITTNGKQNRQGEAVMGRGVALQAKQKWPELPRLLGARLSRGGNHVHAFPELRVFSFPVKHHWADPADPVLLTQSLIELRTLVDSNAITRGLGQKIARVFLPRPGCGNGGLTWTRVFPVVDFVLDDRFMVIERSL